MAPVRARRRSGTSRWVQLLLGISLPALLVLGLVLALGELPIPFLSGSPVLAWTRSASAAGDGDANLADTVALPLTRGAIPAYTAISRAHYFDLATGAPSVVRLPTDTVDDRMVTMADVLDGKLNGRVLARDKPAGYVFRWSDFLPEGARSGIVAGIPPGKRGMWVEVGKIRGLPDLRTGDRFDIVSAFKLAPTEPTTDAATGPFAEQLASLRRAQPKMPSSRVELVVENGQVVVPERTRQIPVTSSGLMTGQRISSQPVREVLIAVESNELAALAAALSIGADLWCAPRSGHPDEVPDARTDIRPDAGSTNNPAEFEFATVEVIEGGMRRRLTTPRAREDG